MSKKVYIIHGREGSPDAGWLYRLRGQLKAIGIEAVGLPMPHPEIPTIDDWVQTMQDQIIPDIDTYIVAHSVGVQTALRRLQTLNENQKIGGLLSVAGWLHLEGLTEEETLVARQWIETPIDFVRVRQVCQMVVALFSDNDPWVPLFDTEEFIQQLEAEVIIEHGMGHMYWLDPMKGYPLLKDILLDMMGGEKLGVMSNELGVEASALEFESENKAVGQVVVRVLDRDGTDMGSFEASKHESILDTAEKHNIDIGYSCRSGACFACACHVKQGFEHVDLGKFGYPLVDVDEEDMLTCIGGVMDDAWDGEKKEIIIKKF